MTRGCWESVGLSGVWTASVCVAPGPPSLVSSSTRAMSVSIFVSEGQVVVGIIVVGIVVVGIIVVGVVGLISTVAAAVVVVTSTEEILQTKEPSPGVPLVWGLSLPPATVAS